jgi:hypothetical protein
MSLLFVFSGTIWSILFTPDRFELIRFNFIAGSTFNSLQLPKFDSHQRSEAYNTSKWWILRVSRHLDKAA